MTHKTVSLGIFLLLGVLLGTPANAVTKNWAVGDGNWAVDSNWLPVGVPTSLDDAIIVFSDGVPRTVTVDNTGPAKAVGSLTVDLTGSATDATTLAISGGSLSEFLATVGDNGNGTVNQTGGTHSISSNTIIGSHSNAVGTYTLSSGSLSTAFSETIGADGTGTFTQTGGLHGAYGLTIGSNSTGLGSYTLSGSSSSLQVTTGEVIGQSATTKGTAAGGSFTQSAGSHQVQQLYIGRTLGPPLLTG